MLRLQHRRNRLIHSHIDCFRFGPVCRLRAITYTTTSLDDDENNDNNGGGSEYVIKNVPSAPISSLFESSDINKWNDRRNNKKNQSRRRPQQQTGQPPKPPFCPLFWRCTVDGTGEKNTGTIYGTFIYRN